MIDYKIKKHRNHFFLDGVISDYVLLSIALHGCFILFIYMKQPVLDYLLDEYSLERYQKYEVSILSLEEEKKVKMKDKKNQKEKGQQVLFRYFFNRLDSLHFNNRNKKRKEFNFLDKVQFISLDNYYGIGERLELMWPLIKEEFEYLSFYRKTFVFVGDMRIFSKNEKRHVARTKVQIQSIISKNMSDLHACYEDEFLLDPKLEGKMLVSWSITSKGKVDFLKITEKTLKNKWVRKCLERHLKTWTYPHIKNGAYTRVYLSLYFTF